MDYSVGSLSDLITGSNTPNKKKVVRRKLTAKKNTLTHDAPVSENFIKFENDTEECIISPKEKIVKKAKKAKKIRKHVEISTSNDIDVQQELEDSENAAPPIKKSKNSKNAERRVNSKEKIIKFEEDPELLSRTVFVGNLPVTSNTKKLKRLFMKYGKVETVRIRGAPVADPKTSKKVAVIKKEFHPERKSFFGYVRFEERDDAVKATEANRMLYQDHHLRVHLCDVQERPDENKAIFVGNLSFYAEEDDLWKLFETCGTISSVRIVRDNKTGIGKGFGYVNFENSDAVPLALEMENVKLKDRELRISICNINAAKKNKKNNKVKKISKPGKPKNHKIVPKMEKVEVQDKEKTVKLKNKHFQGVNFAEKKKKKLNKGLLQKKKIIKQLAPK